jgi:PAT family beta-lactamase induction signal transducer AmpG
VASAVAPPATDSPQSPRPLRPPRPWLFGVASVPYGAFNGLVAVALPYVLRRHGVSVERIASIGAVVQSPTIWYFLWAPAVDMKFRRRTWVIVLSVVSGACAALAFARIGSPAVRTVMLLFVAASVFNQPVSSAVGGLVATVVPNAARGRTGGWSQAGILGGGVFAGGLAVWLSDRAPSAVVGLVAGMLIIAPAFAVLAVREPVTPRGDLRGHIPQMFREVKTMFARREVWVGLVFFLSPIGAGALMNLFSAVASDFHASADVVVWVIALAGVLTPVGAVLGGVVCDRFDRWRAYPIAGLTAAASVAAMLVAPLTPTTFIVGAASYAIATGFCYAAFMALAFDLLGAGGPASSTQFSLFMAAANVPLVYMLRFDGLGHAHYGIRGLLAADALANAAFGIVFLGGVQWFRMARKLSAT